MIKRLIIVCVVAFLFACGAALPPVVPVKIDRVDQQIFIMELKIDCDRGVQKACDDLPGEKSKLRQALR